MAWESPAMRRQVSRCGCPDPVRGRLHPAGGRVAPALMGRLREPEKITAIKAVLISDVLAGLITHGPPARRRAGQQA